MRSELDQYAHAQFDDKAQDEIRAAFRAAFAERDRDDWVAELAPLDTCVAPVLAVAEVCPIRSSLPAGSLRRPSTRSTAASSSSARSSREPMSEDASSR